jgi:transposase
MVLICSVRRISTSNGTRRNAPKFSGENFSIDWHRQKAISPAGKTSSGWSEVQSNTGKPVVKIKFSTRDCRVCPFRSDCTKSKIARRTLTILPKEQFEMQRVARQKRKKPGVQT